MSKMSEKDRKGSLKQMEKKEYFKKLHKLLTGLEKDHPGSIVRNEQERPLIPIYDVYGEVAEYDSPGVNWYINISMHGPHNIKVGE